MVFALFSPSAFSTLPVDFRRSFCSPLLSPARRLSYTIHHLILYLPSLLSVLVFVRVVDRLNSSNVQVNLIYPYATEQDGISAWKGEGYSKIAQDKNPVTSETVEVSDERHEGKGEKRSHEKSGLGAFSSSRSYRAKCRAVLDRGASPITVCE